MDNQQKSRIESEESLAEWLGTHHIPIDQWGKGNAKTVAALWQEITASETELWAEPPLRVIRVVKIQVRPNYGSTLVLTEVEQILRDSRRRLRNQIPGEKIVGAESAEEAALRGLYEEVGVTADAVQFTHIPKEPVIEERASPSFPGLLTQYWFHEVEVVVMGLPEGAFWTEDLGESVAQRHGWAWTDAETWPQNTIISRHNDEKNKII